MSYLAVDVASNATKAAVWSEGRLVDIASRPTPQGETQLVESLVTLVEQLSQEYPLRSWGLSATGVLRAGVLNSANLHLNDFPLQAELEQISLPLQVLVNDMAAVAAGEASDEHPDLAVVFLGTGVGARVVQGGVAVEGGGGAGEIGHWSMDPEGRVCVCGRRGCIETRLGWWSISQQWQAKGRSADGGPKTLALAAGGGDRLAQRLIAEAGEALGIALSLLVSVADPPLIRMGGAVAEELGEMLLPLALAELHDRSFDSEQLVIEPSPWMRLAPLRGLAALAGQPVPQHRDQLA